MGVVVTLEVYPAITLLTLIRYVLSYVSEAKVSF